MKKAKKAPAKKKTAKPVAKKRAKTAAKAPARPATKPSVGTYTPQPIQGIGWAPFRYPLPS